MVRRFFILLSFLIVQGCSIFTPPLGKPVIEEKLNKRLFSSASVGTLSLTPERRVVLVNFRNNRFCAEAPTEIGIDLSSLLKASLGAEKKEVASATAEALSYLETHNNVLNKRTQGIQLFLANSYYTCQMYMNGGIDEGQLLRMQLETLKVVEPIIIEEIRMMYKTSDKEDSKATPDPTKPKSLNDVEKEVKQIEKRILNNPSAKPEEAPKEEAEAH